MDFKNIAFDVFDFDPDNTYPSAKDFASIGDINIKEMRTPHLFNGAARSDGFGNDQSSVLNRLSDDQIVTLLRELTGDNKKNLIIWAANKKPEISPELARALYNADEFKTLVENGIIYATREEEIKQKANE